MPSSAPAPSATPNPAPVAPKGSSLDAFLDKNFKLVAYGCVGLIAASGIYGVVRYNNRQAAEEAAMASTAAKSDADCDIVLQKYKGTTAAGNALLTKSKLLWEQNKKDQSVAALREFVAGYSSHPFYVQGLLSLATRLESLGPNEAKEAQGIYEKIVSEHKTSEVAGLAQIRIADMLWNQGKEAEAQKIYDDIPRQFIGQFPDMVDERVKWIASALPTKEVDGPKPPPEALKAPAPNAAPPINLKSANGSSLPFEIKANPATMPLPAPAPPKPQTSLPNPDMKIIPGPNAAPVAPPNPTIKVEPAKPGATPAPAPTIKVQPPAPGTTQPATTPAVKVEPPKPAAPPAASTPPVSVPPAPAPAPAK